MITRLRRFLGCSLIVVCLCGGVVPLCGAEAGLSAGPLVPRMLRYVRQAYVDPGRIDPPAMLTAAFEEIQLSVPEIMVSQPSDSMMTITVGQAKRTFHIDKLRNLRDLWRHMSQMFDFIETHYDGDTETREFEYLAIDGIFSALDPHSALYRPREYKEFQVSNKGNFGGIGIVIGIRDGQLTVISPIAGTPAGRAGLKAQDRIVQIDENSTVNMPLSEAVDLLRGQIGTQVTVRVERDSRPTFSVSLKRANIEIDSVQSELVSHDGNHYGFVRVKNFQDNTFNEARDQIEALHTAANTLRKQGLQLGLDGLILDLRNNPGGLLYQSVLLTDLFLREGGIVSTVGPKREFIDSHAASGFGTERDYPMIVLINEGSASASEIVSGALQANHRALIIGAQSYGKGSVQSVYDLRDGSGMKMTVAEYLTAGQYRVQEIGITPDIKLIPMTADKKFLNLIENKTFKESDLDKRLSRGAKREHEPLYALRYVIPAEEPEDEDTFTTYTDELDLTDDFAANFAQALLSTGRLAPRKQWPDLSDVVAQAQSEENAKLTKELAKLGLDWAEATKHKKPRLKFTSYLQSNGKRITRAPTDTDVELVVQVTNTGKHAVHQLMGQVEAKTATFANKEVAFGKLSPGQRKSWAIPFTIEPYMISEMMPVEIHFEPIGKHELKPYHTLVPVQGLERPRFSYRYQLSSGKKIPIGRTVTLSLDVKNLGTGKSLDAVASIRTVEAQVPFIETGRVTIGEIAAGATKKAQFKFHVDPEFTGKEFQLQLSILDSKTFDAITDELTLSIDTGAITPASKTWYSAPQITFKAGSIPESTDKATIEISADILDDKQVKDYFVFVDRKKTFYQTNAMQTAQAALTTTVELEPGTNIITLAARDNDLLMSRRVVKVYRTE